MHLIGEMQQNSPLQLPIISDSEMTPLVRMLLEIIKNQQLQIEEQRLYYEGEISKLNDKISRLEKNSSNSSKPPSSDITKPKSEQRQPGKRKIGGQKGHIGNWKRFFESEEVDKISELKVSSCPDCKMPLYQLDKTITHQQAELAAKPVIITEYRLESGICLCCNKTFTADLPHGVIPNQLLGPKLISLYAYLKATMGSSISEISEFSSNVLKLDISRGGVQKCIFRVSKALKPAYEEIAQAIPEQQSLNVDETGWKLNGKKQWVWLFCNHLMAYFVISKTRGCQVLHDVLGDNFLGALTSDFYSAYVKYGSPKQQYCVAHLIREVKFLATLKDDDAKQFGIKLLAYMKRLFKIWHSKESLTQDQWNKKTQRFKSDLNRYIYSLKFENKTDANRIQRRFIKHWAAIFRFLDEPKLYEPTNNLAERTLRPLVRLRRISQGSRGIAGSNWTARAASILATATTQKINPWDFFVDSVYAMYFNSPQPKILPQTI